MFIPIMHALGFEDARQWCLARGIRADLARLVSLSFQGGSSNCLEIPLPREATRRSEEHTSELQSQSNLVCRLLLEKKNTMRATMTQKPATLDFAHAAVLPTPALPAIKALLPATITTRFTPPIRWATAAIGTYAVRI